jgi:valyl-tRNA synthetase
MDKVFDSKKHEESIYKKWEESGAFTPDTNSNKKTFTIVMPPPNANDPLHVGHAMFLGIEDILVRYHRMKGEASLWIPGVDHAGIETQFVFEKKLAKEGKSRFDFDRETLYQKIWNYVQDNSGVAVNQMKRLGASADWSRFTFTLDPKVVDFVYDTFISLHKDTLIYRDEKLVNYCVKCGTGYSELEIDYEERVDPLYYVKYLLHGTENEFVTVATVRPEPIFADTHLAVNPKDKSKQYLIGKQVVNPLTGALMDIIADEYVDPEFGTGVVKLTPAHDANDFEVAKRHGLPMNVAITMWGKLMDQAGPWAGLKVNEARKLIVEFLTCKGMIEKVNEKYSHRVATCYRCHSVIEPMPLPQFFVSVKPLTEKVLVALSAKKSKVHGAGRDKILVNWLTNLRDWNISRQIVWGIRLPVWYEAASNPKIAITFLNAKGEKVRGTLEELLTTYPLSEIKSGLQSLVAPKGATFLVSKTDPGEGFIQETDTFDTWFSSGQWPVVTLKIREGDFETFYPTSVMETGYDILPFWVMRMYLLGMYLTNEVPFKDVYLHGLIRDAQGRKMSKSVGNVINPLDMVEKYGADAVRMALVMGSTPGQDKSVGEQTIKGMRNFSNKIWNATRYVSELPESSDLKENDKAFEAKLNEVVTDVTQNLDKLKIGQAAETIYSAFWHWFCDEMIESHKRGEISTTAIKSGMKTFLSLLHPFAPYVTEASFQATFAKNNELLMSSNWPASISK